MEKQEKVFKELKEQFTKEPVLAAPDIDKKMRWMHRTMQREEYCQWNVRTGYGDR